MNRKLEVPPIPIRSVRKQDNSTAVDSESPMQGVIEPKNEIKVYEIWKVYLEENEEELDFVFVIVTAENTMQGYRNGEWSNVEYKGFYTTIEEAQNEISGYIR